MWNSCCCWNSWVLRPLIALPPQNPVKLLHCSRMVACLLTRKGGSEVGGSRGEEEGCGIILNGWGWVSGGSSGGLNGVICRGIYSPDCHGDSPDFLLLLPPPPPQWGNKEVLARIDTHTGTSEGNSLRMIPPHIPPHHHPPSLWSVIAFHPENQAAREGRGRKISK